MNEEKFYMNKIKGPFNNYLMFEGRGVIFVTNCYQNLGGWGGHSSFLCNREFFLRYIICCNYPKVELNIQHCLCMYASSILYFYMKFDHKLVNV